MRLLRQMLIAAATASCAAAPVAAARLIALDSRDCFIQDGSCIVMSQGGGDDSVLPAGRHADPGQADRSQPAAAHQARPAPRAANIRRLPDAATWMVLATGFCLIGFSLRGSREELLGRP